MEDLVVSGLCQPGLLVQREMGKRTHYATRARPICVEGTLQYGYLKAGLTLHASSARRG
jgi:hypothetical protein